jgi:hypothetical protein
VYEQVYEPVAGSLALSALVAAIPIIVLFVQLAGIRVAAQWASLATLAVALVLAVLVYGMPVGLALNSTLLVAAFGLFPIVWIVIKPTLLTNECPKRFQAYPRNGRSGIWAKGRTPARASYGGVNALAVLLFMIPG